MPNSGSIEAYCTQVQRISLQQRGGVKLKFQMAISLQRIIRSTSKCLILGYGFWGQQIEWIYFRLDQIQEAAARHR